MKRSWTLGELDKALTIAARQAPGSPQVVDQLLSCVSDMISAGQPPETVILSLDQKPYAVSLQAQRVVLMNYLRMKIEADDLHAVADAAMDLRELDAQIRVLGMK